MIGSAGVSLLLGLFTFLCASPQASANLVPTSSAEATIELGPALRKSLHENKVKVTALAPATLEGAVLTLSCSGSVDPLDGAGAVACEGGLELRRSGRSVRIVEVEVDTAGGSLEANLGSGEIGIATASFSATAEGFGARIRSGTLHMTPALAHVLRGRLHLRATGRHPRSKGHRRRHGAGTAKSKPAFVRGRSLGTVSLDAQPAEATVEPGGSLTFLLDPVIATKLRDVDVRISGGAPVGESELNSFVFEVTGGTFDIGNQALTIATRGALRFDQTLEAAGLVIAESDVMLGEPSLELSAATLGADVVGDSGAVPYLGFGDLGRTAVGDLLAPVGALSVDPAIRAVGLQAAPVIISPVAAQTLNGFRRLYENRRREAKPQDEIKAGEPLGTVSLAARVD